MADPAHPPTPCDTDTLLLHGIRCVPDGEGTKWVDVWVSAAEFVPSEARVSAPCGGCGEKVKLVSELATRGWKPADIERVLKAL